MIRHAFPKEHSGCRVSEGATGNTGTRVGWGVDWRDILAVGGMKERRVSRASPRFGAWHMEGGQCQLQGKETPEEDRVWGDRVAV